MRLALEALEGVYQYGSDTLSGPAKGQPDDRKWQRDGVLEMTNRAYKGIKSLEEALKQEQGEPVALVTGVYGGRFTYAPFKESLMLPIGMALYSSPQQRKPPEWYAQWIRNNYQDHPNIATLCDEMTKAAHGIKE